MPILTIDTATERSVVAIVDAKQMIYYCELPFGLTNSKELLPAIQTGLQKNQLSVQQLRLIAVGIGPGSYTGVRVAAAVAQGLAYASQVPLVGIPTLACFSPKDFEGDFAVLVDAKIGGAYLLTAVSLNGTIVIKSQSEVCPIEKVEEKLNGIELLVTPSKLKLQPKLDALYGQHRWQWQELPPNPLLMSDIAELMFSKGETVPAGSLNLLYLRKSQAEETAQ